MVGFYNQQFLTAAGIASSGLSDTLSAAANAAAPAKRSAPAAASTGTLTGETIALVNPQKNYAQFLLRALLPMIIHVVITLDRGLFGRLRIPPPQRARNGWKAPAAIRSSRWPANWRRCFAIFVADHARRDRFP